MTHPTHEYFSDPALTRLMGMVVALAGEVFVLKAQNQRLTEALRAADALPEEALSQSGDTDAMAQWLAEEGDAFAAAIMAPLIEPDMAQRRHDEIFGTGTIAKKISQALAGREPGP